MTSRTHPTQHIIGNKVYNPGGEYLGKVCDLMVDLESGKILYAALGCGGFWGFGTRYFAVPVEALSVSENRQLTLSLELSRRQLKNKKGFDKHNWPSYGNAEECVSALTGYEGFRRSAAGSHQ